MQGLLSLLLLCMNSNWGEIQVCVCVCVCVCVVRGVSLQMDLHVLDY